MLTWIATYVATALVFLALDGCWLAVAGTRLYRPELGELLAAKVRIAPAVVFYLLYVFGMVWFCVAPAFAAGVASGARGAWTRALISGALLGLVAYGAYDLTCQATMRTWSLKVTLADLAWGAFASAIASTAGLFAARAAARLVG